MLVDVDFEFAVQKCDTARTNRLAGSEYSRSRGMRPSVLSYCTYRFGMRVRSAGACLALAVVGM